MKRLISFLLLLILIISTKNFAQGEAALPLLYISPSPQSTGLGWTGVSNPNEDAFGFHYNPAQLGYFGQNNNLSFQIYPGSTDWVNFDRIDINSTAFNIGYNFKKELNRFNLSAGAGFIHSKMDFGMFSSPLGNYNSYDLFDAYGFGVAINYYITFAFGITFKNIHSQPGENLYSSFVYIKPLEANAMDYGFLLTLPIMDLFDNNTIELSDNSKLIPDFKYTLGYSRLNIGDEVYYRDPAQSDPLPLTARLGHTLSFSFDYQSEDIFFNMVGYDLILEADDILIKRSSAGFSYQGLLGDIDFGKHLLLLKGDDKVVVHRGHAINLFETISVLNGSFNGRGYSRGVKTNGLIISSLGLTKLFGAVSKNTILQFIANHIELKYRSSTIFNGESIETDLSGLSVSLFNFSFN